MTILWDLSCCVEYCGARGKCCIKHGERHVFPNYQQGRFPAPPQDNTRGKCSSLANETALSRKCKKDHDFFLLSRLKAFSPAEAVLPVLGTHPPTPACLEPLHRGISCHSSRHFSKRNVLPQGNCNPGKSLGTRTEGKQMGFQTIFFALSKGHWSG